MRKRYMIPFLFVLVLMIIYWAGPRLPETSLGTDLPDIPAGIGDLEQYVKAKEAGYPVKPGNESMILWGDSIGRPTPFVLLYLHGFSDGHFEGYPVTCDFVQEFKVNAYLPRLAGHGLREDEPLLEMTPENLYRSAREALGIACKLGEKVILMGTSTGCTLALMLAADFPDLVDGLILYSPNIKIKNPWSPLLGGPWGLQITRVVHGGKYAVSASGNSEDCKYWYCRYRLEAQVYLQQLLKMRMNRKEFEKVRQPVFLGYYYKDKEHQDQTIEVKAALKMFDELGTPDAWKEKVAFPEAGVHVIACGLTSKSVPEVEKATFGFARRVLKMK